jgi:hypothetical protein
MKNKTLFALLIISNFAFSQNDTLWYDKEWKPSIKENAAFFRPPVLKAGDKFRIVDYYIDGTMQMEGTSLQESEKNGMDL